MRLAVPDLVSNSYFPAVAAVEGGYLRAEGIAATCEMRFPPAAAMAALRDGELDLVAASAHAPLAIDPGWRDLCLLGALAQHTYWFLVLRPDLDVDRDRLEALRDVRLGAAPGPDGALRALLADSGIDTDAAGITIEPVAPPVDLVGPPSFGVVAANALAAGRIDGFWANGMGAEVAVRRGVGKVVVDARRDREPLRSYTFPALIGHRRLVERQPELVRSVVRALRRSQTALAADPAVAARVGAAVFPPDEAAIIPELVRRDAPFYAARIEPVQVEEMVRFAAGQGLGTGRAEYDTVVPPPVREAW